MYNVFVANTGQQNPNTLLTSARVVNKIYAY